MDLFFMFHGILINVSFLGPGQIRSKKFKSTRRVLAIFIHYYFIMFIIVVSAKLFKHFDYHLSADIPDCPAQQIFTRHQKLLHDVLHTIFI